MSVAAEIGQHLRGATEAAWHTELVERGGEGRGLGKTSEVAEEAQLAGLECIQLASGQVLERRKNVI